jgi:four helix bundle suffix protein
MINQGLSLRNDLELRVPAAMLAAHAAVVGTSVWTGAAQGTKPLMTASLEVRGSPCGFVHSSAQLVANGALSLLNLCCYLLDRQIASLEKALVEEGGFT